MPRFMWGDHQPTIKRYICFLHVSLKDGSMRMYFRTLFWRPTLLCQSSQIKHQEKKLAFSQVCFHILVQRGNFWPKGKWFTIPCVTNVCIHNLKEKIENRDLTLNFLSFSTFFQSSGNLQKFTSFCPSSLFAFLNNKHPLHIALQGGKKRMDPL